MTEAIRKVNVIGHLHPDTDSICSAMAYAYLKNQTGTTQYEARRAGTVSRETAFALKHFGFDEPALITSVAPQIKDTDISKLPAISSSTSLFAAWRLMKEIGAGTLCVIDEKNMLQGLIAIKDIANANMDILDDEGLTKAATPVTNILTTLNAKLLCGDENASLTQGHVRVGTSPEMMDGIIDACDVVLTTNRYETQNFAVSAGASCIVICNGASPSDVVLQSAKERGCIVITTSYNTYAAARLISMAIPVRACMLSAEKIIRFSVNTTVDDAKKTISQTGHRFFPVLDEDGSYVGVVGSANMLKIKKKHVILVDHNERSQAVDGLEQAEIMEIIDHHRIGSIETSSPALFRNMPVGCTSTIIYGMYKEAGVEIPKNIAGLMLSAIMSDTLAFRSPTCTHLDVDAGKALAAICGEDIPTYSDAMFDAGADLTGRTAEDVFNGDFKVFSRGKAHFGVGQASFMTESSRKAAEALVGPYLKTGAESYELPMVFYMFTDVKSKTTEMMFWGEDASEIATIVEQAFGVKPVDGMAVLKGVVSRKKQIIPPLMSLLQDSEHEN